MTVLGKAPSLKVKTRSGCLSTSRKEDNKDRIDFNR